MTHKILTHLTHGQVPKLCYLTAAYTTVELALAFLVVTGFGRTAAEGLKGADGWMVLGMIAVAALCAFNETTKHTH